VIVPAAAGIALARHGETDYNAQRRFQGHLPIPLNERGLEQAYELAAVAAQRPWAALYCSPLARARETAEIVGAAIGHHPMTDARFAETDCGDWTDRFFDDVQAAEPELFAAWHRGDPAFAFPGGESFAHQQLRVLEGIGAAFSARPPRRAPGRAWAGPCPRRTSCRSARSARCRRSARRAR
jgi:broad specificity phosphatase PhoE